MTTTIPAPGQGNADSPMVKLEGSVEGIRTAEDAAPDALLPILEQTQKELDDARRGTGFVDPATIERLQGELEIYRRVELTRGMVHSRITQLLNWLPHLIHAVGKPAARTVGEVINVTLTLIGEILGGAMKGGKAAIQAWKGS